MNIKNVIAVVAIVIISVSIVGPIISDPPEPKTLDVVIIDGQSNAEYGWNSINRSNKLLVDLPDPTHNLYYYGSEDMPNHYPGTDSDGIYKMFREDHWQIGGLEPSLGYYYSERAGHDVLTINVARGATSISWLGGTDGKDYASDTINAALNEISGYSKINMVGWLWLQGEQDKNMAVDEYKEYFLGLMSFFDTTFDVEDCYIAKTRSYWGGNATVAQDQIASTYPNVEMTTITETFTEENGLLVNNDPIHYSQKGRNVVGEALADMIKVNNVDNDVYSALEIIPLVISAGIILMVVTLVIRRGE